MGDEVFNTELRDMPYLVNLNLVEYLDVEGLFKAAQAAPWLESFVLDEYRGRFSHLRVALRPGEDSTPDVEIIGRYILVNGANCRDFIRIFDQFIEVMKINYENISTEDAEDLNRHVGMHCGGTLRSLTLNNWPDRLLFNSFRTQFSQVGYLEIENSNIDNLSQAPDWFTRVDCLKLSHNQITPDIIEPHFPLLRYLDIEDRFATFDSIRRLWRRNCRLWELRINMNQVVFFGNVMDSIAHHPLLLSLTIDALPSSIDHNVLRLLREHPTLVIFRTSHLFIGPYWARELMEKHPSLRTLTYNILDPDYAVIRWPFDTPGWHDAGLVDDHILTMERTPIG